MEDTFIDGWNSCRAFIIEMLEKEIETWTPNSVSTAAAKGVQGLIKKEAVLGLQDGSYRLPSIRQTREKNDNNRVATLRTIPMSGSGLQPTKSPTKTSIGQMTDRERELVNQLTIADELDGTWAEKWKEIQRKEKGKNVSDSDQGSNIRSE